MGYYSQTTKKLMDQIGEPYTTRVSGGRGSMPDFSSLILALALMPQLSKAAAAGNTDPVGVSEAALAKRARNINPETGTFYPSALPQPIPETTVVPNVTRDPFSSMFGGGSNPLFGGGSQPGLNLQGLNLQDPLVLGFVRALFGIK